jgi:hypothetical protein
MASPSDLEVIYAAANRLEDLLTSLDIDTRGIVITAFEVGLLSQQKLIDQLREGSSLLEADYFENVDPENNTPTTKISKKNYSITVRKGRAKGSY